MNAEEKKRDLYLRQKELLDTTKSLTKRQGMFTLVVATGVLQRWHVMCSACQQAAIHGIMRQQADIYAPGRLY